MYLHPFWSPKLVCCSRDPPDCTLPTYSPADTPLYPHLSFCSHDPPGWPPQVTCTALQLHSTTHTQHLARPLRSSHGLLEPRAHSLTEQKHLNWSSPGGWWWLVQLPARSTCTGEEGKALLHGFLGALFIQLSGSWGLGVRVRNTQHLPSASNASSALSPFCSPSQPTLAPYAR